MRLITNCHNYTSSPITNDLCDQLRRRPPPPRRKRPKTPRLTSSGQKPSNVSVPIRSARKSKSVSGCRSRRIKDWSVKSSGKWRKSGHSISTRAGHGPPNPWPVPLTEPHPLRRLRPTPRITPFRRAARFLIRPPPATETPLESWRRRKDANKLTKIPSI